MEKIKNSTTKKYDVVPPVKLTPKDEEYLRKKFDRYAKALQWVGRESTYYIHVGSAIIKHTDTESLFNLLARAYKKNNAVMIW